MNFWFIILWTCISTILGYLKVKYSYWELNGVKQLKTHFLFGNFFKLKSINHEAILQEVYDQFKGKAKIAGIYIFTKPVAVILDLNVVNSVLIKDFDKFVNRMEYKNDKDILATHLFNVEASLWRPLRQKFTPTFTSGKMKFMFPSINKITNELQEAYIRSIEESPDQSVNISDLSARYTTDVIGTCMFGLESNSLTDPSAQLKKMCTMVFGRTNYNIKWYLFKQTYANLMKYFGFKRYPQFIEDFFLRVIRESFLAREKHNVQRNDFLNILIDLKNTKDENGTLTYDQISAQSFVFFIAGVETSSTNMTYLLYELARHPEIQEKLRSEIVGVMEKYDNELTYEAMMEMKYLDQVISETLRLYPALANLQRISTEEYTVPQTNITLDKGTTILIPVRAIHYDPEYYENPYEFKPERFSPEEVKKRHPQSFLAFGDGPRNCIGLRFGRMQNRIALVTLLTNFKFSVSAKTCKTIEYSKHSFVTLSAKNILLKVDRL